LRKPINHPENDISDLLDEVETTQSRQREFARNTTNAENSRDRQNPGVNRRSSRRAKQLTRLGVAFVYYGLIVTVISWIFIFALSLIGKPSVTFSSYLYYTSLALSLTGKSICLLGAVGSPNRTPGLAMFAVIAESISIVLIFNPITASYTGDQLTAALNVLIYSFLSPGLSLTSLLAFLLFMKSCATSMKDEGLTAAIEDTYRQTITLYLGMPFLTLAAGAFFVFTGGIGFLAPLIAGVITLVVLVRWTISYLQTLSYFSLNYR